MTPMRPHTVHPNRMRRVLVVAYACSPGRGSEESVGWDTAEALARKGFEVTVLTRLAERQRCPAPSERPSGLRLESWDLPKFWQSVFSRMGKIGVEFGYLAWLLGARSVVRQLHAQNAFDSAQHVTYARYWMPSPLAVLDLPWILGPVGGGESIPSTLRASLSRSGRVFEAVRDAMRWMGERSSAVRHAARSAHVCLANTRETAERLRHLGARHVEIINSAALADEEVERLGALSTPDRTGFLSIGRLLDWKGFHLGLEAFARSGLRNETYTIVGEGPFRSRLEALAGELGVADRVRFTGLLPRQEVFALLGRSRALIHPSLHESGGFVVLEAMAAGTPVLCVDAGGPGLFVTGSTGYAVAPTTQDRTISGLSVAMQHMVLETGLVDAMQSDARRHVARNHTMSVKVDHLVALHLSMASTIPSDSDEPRSERRAAPERNAVASDVSRTGRWGVPS